VPRVYTPPSFPIIESMSVEINEKTMASPEFIGSLKYANQTPYTVPLWLIRRMLHYGFFNEPFGNPKTPRNVIDGVQQRFSKNSITIMAQQLTRW